MSHSTKQGQIYQNILIRLIRLLTSVFAQIMASRLYSKRLGIIIGECDSYTVAI